MHDACGSSASGEDRLATSFLARLLRAARWTPFLGPPPSELEGRPVERPAARISRRPSPHDRPPSRECWRSDVNIHPVVVIIIIAPRPQNAGSKARQDSIPPIISALLYRRHTRLQEVDREHTSSAGVENFCAYAGPAPAPAISRREVHSTASVGARAAEPSQG